MITKKKHALEYVPRQRFVVEIRDEQTERVFYSKRIGIKKDAVDVRDEYNLLKDVLAIIIDTKTARSESWVQI